MIKCNIPLPDLGNYDCAVPKFPNTKTLVFGDEIKKLTKGMSQKELFTLFDKVRFKYKEKDGVITLESTTHINDETGIKIEYNKNI